MALSVGGDDYITKPFIPEELLARVKAQIRRSEQNSSVETDEEIYTAPDLELGTGNGIIPLILAHKNNDINIVGVELQESAAELAEENVERNNLKERITIINKDIRNLSDEFWERFDVVCCNPPYFKKGTGMISENDAKMVARHETTADISDFLKYSEKLLVAEGELFMVHRPE